MRKTKRAPMAAIVAIAVVAGMLISVTSIAIAQEQGPQPKSAWTTSTPKSEGEPRGYVQFQDYCAVCHGAGVGKPGTIALKEKYKGAEPALLAERTDLTQQLVKTYVRNGISVMPFFRKTEISDADLDAIAEYLTRNNKPGAR
ncbi:MAG TPA: cytochrome c [Candidatus Dormibacteraeota bacterium]|nr:cytochrome c [Candidatus Dormibacteraeota bacterium]